MLPLCKFSTRSAEREPEGSGVEEDPALFLLLTFFLPGNSPSLREKILEAGGGGDLSPLPRRGRPGGEQEVRGRKECGIVLLRGSESQRETGVMGACERGSERATWFPKPPAWKHTNTFIIFFAVFFFSFLFKIL